MRCDQVREAASARLDGEPMGISTANLDQHLMACGPCRAWLAEATRWTRAVRIATASVPDLTAKILADAVLPVTRVRRRRAVLRIAVAVVGLIQIGLALPDLFGLSIDMPMSAHMAHESAAFNIAVGVALLGVARRPRRAAAILPMLSALVGVLALLSARDLATGAVAAGRLATHVAAAIGLGLLYALRRFDGAGPRERLARIGADADLDLKSEVGGASGADDAPGIRGVA